MHGGFKTTDWILIVFTVEYSLLGKYLPSIHEALGLLLSIKKYDTHTHTHTTI